MLADKENPKVKSNSLRRLTLDSPSRKQSFSRGLHDTPRSRHGIKSPLPKNIEAPEIGIDTKRYPDGIAKGTIELTVKRKSKRRETFPTLIEGDGFSAIVSLYEPQDSDSLLFCFILADVTVSIKEPIIKIQSKRRKYLLTLRKESDFNYWKDWFNQVLAFKGEASKPLPVYQCSSDVCDFDQEASQPVPQTKSLMQMKIQNSNGKLVTISQIMNGEITMFLMVRHFGCTLCKRTVTELCKKAQEIIDLGVNIAVVGNGSVTAALQFCQDLKFPKERLFTDKSRALYGFLNLKRGMLSPKAWNLIQESIREGYPNVSAKGTQNGSDAQLGGLFVLSPDNLTNPMIIYQFRSQFLGQEPNFTDTIAVLKDYGFNFPDKIWTEPAEQANRVRPDKSNLFARDFNIELFSDSDEIFRPVVHDRPYFESFFTPVGPRSHSIYLCSYQSTNLIVAIKGNLSQAVVFGPLKSWKVRLPLTPLQKPLIYILNRIGFSNAEDFSIHESTDSQLCNDLKEFESQMSLKGYSAGLLHILKGEPQYGSKSLTVFQEFTSRIGEKIFLEDWRSFPGDLDCTKKKATGDISVVSKIEGRKIMFQVGTFVTEEAEIPAGMKDLLFSKSVLVLYLEETEKIPAVMFGSNANCLIGIKIIADKFRVEVFVRKGFPAVLPGLPIPPLFLKNEIRDWLLSKIVNASDRYRDLSLRKKIIDQIFSLTLKPEVSIGFEDFTQEMILKEDDVVFEKEIAKGGFGVVYRGKYVKSSETVAIKKLMFNSALGNWIQWNSFVQEVNVHSKLKHENLVNLFGVSVSPYFMVIEWVPGGSLYDVIGKTPEVFKNDLLLEKFSMEICEGLRFMHELKPFPIVHRDVKSPNILISSLDLNETNIKIADFGTSVEMVRPLICGSVAENPLWVAPEILMECYYNCAVDMYAFGTVVWELLTRERPYKDMPFMNDVVKSVVSGARMEIPDGNEKLKNLITLCWSQEPEKRPTSAQALSLLRKGK